MSTSDPETTQDPDEPRRVPRLREIELPLEPPIGWVRSILGWTCIVLGIVGLFLPFLQGIALLVAGVALLGRRSWAGRKVRTVILWFRLQRRRLRNGRNRRLP